MPTANVAKNAEEAKVLEGFGHFQDSMAAREFLALPKVSMSGGTTQLHLYRSNCRHIWYYRISRYAKTTSDSTVCGSGLCLYNR